MCNLPYKISLIASSPSSPTSIINLSEEEEEATFNIKWNDYIFIISYKILHISPAIPITHIKDITITIKTHLSGGGGTLIFFFTFISSS
jgi:hypothetical protein